jgi:hypothetical protein
MQATPFLWVLRVLASLFLLGYLTYGFLVAFVLGDFPGQTLVENGIFILLALVFMVGFYFLWSHREGLAGIIFILWYAALWPSQILIAGDNFEDLPAPGTYMLIIGLLCLLYWYSKRKAASAHE